MREGLHDHLSLWFCFSLAYGVQAEQNWIPRETSTESCVWTTRHAAKNVRSLCISFIPTSDFIPMTRTLKPRLAKLCILIVWWPFPYFEQVNASEKIYINLVSWHFPADYFFFFFGGGEDIRETRTSLLLLVQIFLNWCYRLKLHVGNDYIFLLGRRSKVR